MGEGGRDLKGTPQQDRPLDPDARRRLAWYRQMIQVRLFETKTQELFVQGKIEGTTNLCQGQEATSAGAAHGQ
jgi:TPP-dependent pyruvate/acetoin dehydrogenase alpha subunit